MFHTLHEAGNTIVLITHDNQIAGEAERKIYIRDGKVKEDENYADGKNGMECSLCQ